jgi:hypothetical protein
MVGGLEEFFVACGVEDRLHGNKVLKTSLDFYDACSFVIVTAVPKLHWIFRTNKM